MKTLTAFAILLFFSTVLLAQINIEIKVYLEGAYNSGSLNTTLNTQAVIPTSQPYNQPPWNYSGTESVTEIPSSDVVDWVLVELRDKENNTTIVETRAAFLLSNGQIVDLDGSSPVEFDVANDGYYATVKHRNHFPILASDLVYPNTCPGVPTVTYGGQIYNTVEIGTQCWLRENLNVGVMIQSTTGGQLQTDNGSIEKFCYENNESNCNTYGGLYEWYEAMEYITTAGTQGICPEGWHIPTLAEMQTLQDYVNDDPAELVDESQTTNGYTATNVTGFSALFAGMRAYDSGVFGLLGENTFFWSSEKFYSEDYPSGIPYYLTLDYNDFGIFSDPLTIGADDVNFGFSVRCIKD